MSDVRFKSRRYQGEATFEGLRPNRIKRRDTFMSIIVEVINMELFVVLVAIIDGWSLRWSLAGASSRQVWTWSLKFRSRTLVCVGKDKGTCISHKGFTGRVKAEESSPSYPPRAS